MIFVETHNIYRQLKKKINLLVIQKVVTHDAVIINFRRKLMVKISFVLCNIANYWRMFSRWRYDLLVIITQLFNILYVYSSSVNTVAVLYNKCMKSPFFLDSFFRGWEKSTQKFIVEFMLLRHRVIRLPHTPLNP